MLPLVLSLSKETSGLDLTIRESIRTLRQAQRERRYSKGDAMKRLYVALALIASCTCSKVCAYELAGRSFYQPRSPATNAARGLVGFCNLFYHPEPPNSCWRNSLLATAAYDQSFQRYRVATYYFNNDRLSITGSQYPDREEEDILADYFGLSPAFASKVRMCPSIRTFYFDVDGAVGYRHFFARLQIPAVWTQWHFRLNEERLESGAETPFPADYMATPTITAPVTSFPCAMTGDFLFGQMQTEWTSGKICGSRSSGGMSDVRLTLGGHLFDNEDYDIYLSFLAIAPTSDHSRSTFFFEPIRGNGRHTEMGVGFDGYMVIWESNGTQTWTLYGSAYITHLFKAREIRSFDFCCNGFFSRYLLLKEFDDTGTYDGKLIPGINVTTLPCKVSVAAQCDIVVMFGYLRKGLEFDVGYNAWIRTRERLCITGKIPENRYGIKGIQNVTNPITGLPDNSTQSRATIHGNTLTPFEQARTADPNSPVFITTDDLNPRSGASTSAFTSKFFGHLGYLWSCRYVNPYLGFGGEVEFEGVSPERNVQANHNSVAQWGVWLKGGMQI